MRSDEVVTEQEQQSTAEIVHNTISDLRGEARRNFVHRLVNLISECELGSHVVESPHMVAEATHEMMMEILDAERAPGSQEIHRIPREEQTRLIDEALEEARATAVAQGRGAPLILQEE